MVDSKRQQDFEARLVRTDDGSLTLRHQDHDECYHSSLGARLEARMLYVERSGLMEALAAPGERSALRLLDVGLGLGYNAHATLTAWLAAEAPPAATLVSLEHDASLVSLLASGVAPWQRDWLDEERALSRLLTPTADGTQYVARIDHPRHGVSLHWQVLVGDAFATLEEASHGGEREGLFDFIWQDPFSPEKNPGLWNAPWFASLRRHCAPDATLATYSVARLVKDALDEAGWSWRRIATGIARKRHWLLATPKS